MRENHTATLLPNGKVLIAGGVNAVETESTAELFDPGNGSFASTGPMTSGRQRHTATLLRDGTVLLTGGYLSTGIPTGSAEIYDPLTGTFTATAEPMARSRVFHTATLLASGQVLVAGGSLDALAKAELYDPVSKTFTPTGNDLSAGRLTHTATLLQNGKVLLAGGDSAAASADLYDPDAGANGTFTAVAVSMSSIRRFHVATALPNGTVLLAGGFDNSSFLASAEIYDPAGGTNGTFTATSEPMSSPRYQASATLLPNGMLLIAGGFTGADYSNTTDVYDSSTDQFSSGLVMPESRCNHTATLLPATVLFAGGSGPAVVDTADLYPIAGGTFTAIATSMGSARTGGTATLLPDGKVLIAGGTDTVAAEVFDWESATPFAATVASMNAVHQYGTTSTLLNDGRVLIAGGSVGPTATAVVELYDPATGAFTATDSLSSTRQEHTATLLPDGNVLIAGGRNESQHLNTAEIFDPVAGTFSSTATTMTSQRSLAAAALLRSGKVLITGGFNGTSYSTTAELYDPATRSFAAAGFITPRGRHTSTMLPDGRILLTGGLNGGSLVSGAELYDPESGAFTSTAGSLNAARIGHVAVALADGRVLIAGGSDPDSAELYDPATELFTWTAAPMSSERNGAAATLLPNGRVLILGGVSGIAPVASAEEFDTALELDEARRPVVSPIASPLCQPASLSLTGTQFTGDSEASSGSSSPTNWPLLRLQRVEDTGTRFVPLQSFSASSLLGSVMSDQPSGFYRISVVTNAIPSVEDLVLIETPPAVGSYDAATIDLSGSITIAPSSLPSGYAGSKYSQRATASGAFTGSLSVNPITGAVTITDASPIGDYTITVSASNSCGSDDATFALAVLGPPAAITATGGTLQSTSLYTMFPMQLEAKVTDSAGHPLSGINVSFSVAMPGAGATFDPNPTATNSSGIVSVAATANGFLGTYDVTAEVDALQTSFALTNTNTPTNVVALATSATTVVISWTAEPWTTYEVHRTAAGGISETIGFTDLSSLADSTVVANKAYIYDVRATTPAPSPFSASDLATTVMFSDAPLVPGTTKVRTVHFTQLRAAVDAVRALAGLAPGVYTDTVLTAGTTRVKALHVTDLRSRLDAARSALLLPPLTYSQTVTSGATVRASQIEELRAGVR